MDNILIITYPENGQKFTMYHNGMYGMKVEQYPNGLNNPPDETFHVKLGHDYESSVDEMFRQIKTVLISNS